MIFTLLSIPYQKHQATLDAQWPSEEEQEMRAFSPHLVPKPPPTAISWPALSTSKPLDVEIGCGSGLHAISYARKNQHRHLIAIERTTKCRALLEYQESSFSLGNLTAVRGDAINWLTHYGQPESISRIFILYPNPYPKEKQRNLRWHNMPFMGHLKLLMRPQGEIVLATNEVFYATQARAVMTQLWGFELLSETLISNTFDSRTLFEKKYVSRGDKCWNLVFKKVSVPN